MRKILQQIADEMSAEKLRAVPPGDAAKRRRA
jgi:hypothetical protein